MGNPLKYTDPTGMDACATTDCISVVTTAPPSDSTDLSGFYEFLWASSLFSSGALDAVLSNASFGMGRHDFSDPYFQAGQTVGDGASIVLGLAEALAGEGAFLVGTAADFTGYGVFVEVPVQVVSGVAVIHGGTTSALGAINLMESNRGNGDKTAEQLIPASMKKSGSYRSELANKTHAEIVALSKGKGPLAKAAKQMKILIEQAPRLIEKRRR
jgi:hypothetical protein